MPDDRQYINKLISSLSLDNVNNIVPFSENIFCFIFNLIRFTSSFNVSIPPIRTEVKTNCPTIYDYLRRDHTRNRSFYYCAKKVCTIRFSCRLSAGICHPDFQVRHSEGGNPCLSFRHDIPKAECAA
ncbi:MAG: hypothetical protein A2W89_07970 [Bacteroidetes bacterium GWE2_42_39]|nr:MAG: hypothetical protein A2W89_07970 [Bacteroidetes bacterium GWE2_42_39]